MPEDKQEKLIDVGEKEGADIELEQKEAVTEIETPVASSKKQEVVETTEKKEETSDEKQEVKKDELDDYSKDVQKRIAKLTKKFRDAERERDDAVKFARSVKEENEKLAKKFSNLETYSLKERESKIKSTLEGLKAKLTIARSENQTAEEVEIQKEIAKLGYEEARIAELKQASESYQEPKKSIENFKIPVSAEMRPDPAIEQRMIVGDSRAESWGSKNKWFGTDRPMTYVALDIHNKLVNEEGYDPNTDEYYAEIDKRIRLDFPHKFVKNEATESTKPVQTVASAKRSTKPGRKTVRLTPSQVAIAKKLGVPLEEYAKQLTAKEV